MRVDFTENSTALTLGVEQECQVLDNATLLLTPRAAEILRASNSPKLTYEMFQSTVEVVTGVCADVHEVRDDFNASINQLKSTTHQLGLCLASTGTHPQADYRDRLITESPRYHELMDRNQWLIRRMAVYGMHVHLGMKNGDDCIQFNNFFLHFMPHLIALSASSPFWQKMDTGLICCRPTMYEALPTAGIPYMVKNWSHFEKLLSFLQRSDAIRSLRDLWWDLRPSPKLGTLEIRICDGLATTKELFGVVSFVHALAHWFNDHRQEWSETRAPLKQWIFRENKWRAIRYGLDASVIVTRTGKTRVLRTDIAQWLDTLSPYIEKLAYQPFIQVINEILTNGNSAQRQRNVFSATHDLSAVAAHNAKEFTVGEPLWN